jgi:hypothetical protein
MRSQALEHCILGFTVLATLVWFDLLPAAMLRDVVMVLLGWAAFSTLLVASAGAWVAFARARARARSHPERRLTTRRG